MADSSSREVIRRLLKGDHLTEVRRRDGGLRYSYVVGYGGNSPLRVNENLASYLIRTDIVEYSVGADNIYDTSVDDEAESHYALSNEYSSTETRLLNSLKYSLGDTVEYKHWLYDKNRKGCITKEVDPLCEEVLLNGITNETHSSKDIIGITRMVLIEKKIKNKKSTFKNLISRDSTDIVNDNTFAVDDNPYYNDY